MVYQGISQPIFADVRLRRARSPREGGVAGVQMGEVRDLVPMEGAAAPARPGWRRAQNRLRSKMTAAQWRDMWRILHDVTNSAHQARKEMGD
jgi:hypothetical protein